MKLGDKILIVSLLICSVLSYAWLFFASESGMYVTVSVEGEFLRSYSMQEDGVYVLEDGERYHVIAISEGTVSMQEANCPDLLCVKHRAISKVGETIVCLPNQVVLELEGAGDAPEIDAVVGQGGS